MIHRSTILACVLWLSATAVTPAPAESLDGNLARGGELFRAKCFACHSLDTDRIGPRLAGVVGRPAGAVPGYAYSPALAKAGLVWNAQSLDRWLAGPREFLPGSRMPFALRDGQARSDLIAYLATRTVQP